MPLPPYPDTYPPIPSFENRHEWIYFINGYSRRKVRVTNPADPRVLAQTASSRPSGSGSFGDQAAVPGVECESLVDGDEEEEMNAAPPIYDIEEETERHRPREPTVAIMSRLDNVSARRSSLFDPN